MSSIIFYKKVSFLVYLFLLIILILHIKTLKNMKSILLFTTIFIVLFSCNSGKTTNNKEQSPSNKTAITQKKPKAKSNVKDNEYPLSIKALKNELKLSGKQIKQIQYLNKDTQGKLRSFSRKNSAKRDRINYKNELVKTKMTELRKILTIEQFENLEVQISEVKDLKNIKQIYPF